jgi:hypothetical protein
VTVDASTESEGPERATAIMAEKNLTAATGPYTADIVPNARKQKKAVLESAKRTKSQQKALLQTQK